MVRTATNYHRIVSEIRLSREKSFSAAEMACKVNLRRQHSLGSVGKRTESNVAGHLINMSKGKLLTKGSRMGRYKPTPKLIEAADFARRAYGDDASSRQIGTLIERKLGKLSNVTKVELATENEALHEQVIELNGQLQEAANGPQADAMDVEMEVDGAGSVQEPGAPSFDSGAGPSQLQAPPPPLPSYPSGQPGFVEPVTPIRKNGSGFLPTPPDTNEVRRHGSRRFEPESEMPQIVESFPIRSDDPVLLPTQLEHERNCEATTAEVQMKHDEMARQVEDLKRQLSDCLDKIQFLEAQSQAQTQECQDLRQREAGIREHTRWLEKRMNEFVNLDANILTIANARIVTQTKELAKEQEVNYGLSEFLMQIVGLARGALYHGSS